MDDNYNTPHSMAGTPRTAAKLSSSSPQPTAALYSVSSRNGSVRSQSRPLFPHAHQPPPPPMLHVPPPPPLPPPNGSNQLTAAEEEEAVYTEPGVASYTEPYRAMRYSPYYGYGPVLSEIENTLMKNYPPPPHHHVVVSGESSPSPSSFDSHLIVPAIHSHIYHCGSGYSYSTSRL